MLAGPARLQERSAEWVLVRGGWPGWLHLFSEGAIAKRGRGGHFHNAVTLELFNIEEASLDNGRYIPTLTRSRWIFTVSNYVPPASGLLKFRPQNCAPDS